MAMHTRVCSRRAFTTAEVVIAVAISTLVIASAVMVSQNVGRTLHRQTQWSEMHENLRMAADVIAADIRMSGYGCEVPEAELATWVNWVGGITGRVNVVQGASPADPDTLSLVGAFKGEVGQLSGKAPAGSGVLRVHASVINLDGLKGRLVWLGRLELLRVTAVDSAQNRLTISTHPTTVGVGLKYAYGNGTPIEVVDVLTFNCNTKPASFPGVPYVTKDDHSAGDGVPEVQKMVVVGIEDMQVTQSSNLVSVVLRGRTRHPELGYTHPLYGDAFRRDSVVVSARPRNPQH
jgi:hypothetical protein